jgi:type IV pilus assembly protein PilM
MSVAAIDFDPYRDWLKIADAARPLNPYQLLRLALLEADQTKIRAAYARQMDLLNTKDQGDDDRLVQRLRGELQRACDLLLNAERKAVLDGELRRQSRASIPQPSAEAQAAAGNQVQCRDCGRGNAPQRRFCGDCGAPLWEKCPQCSAECAADEVFCGGCGANIRGELDGQLRTYREQLQAAVQAAAAHRYDAALTQLRRLAAVDDHRFASIAEQALRSIETVERRRDNLLAHAAEQFHRGQEFVAAHAYEQAIAAVTEVDPALRTPEMEALLEQAQVARQELLRLSGEIRQGMEQKQYAGLLLKIERLLALKPGHAQAQGIAGQLRDHFYKLAKSKLAAFQYAAANEILLQIPHFVRTPEIDTLQDTAEELTALFACVQDGAQADDVLAALADKLVKFAPQNEEVARLRQRLANRLQKSPTTPRLAAPDWQPSPIKTPLGPPVEWLGYFTRIEPMETAAATLKEHPGEFFIALGLALQGIGVAETSVNLMSAEKGSVMAHLQGWQSLFSSQGPAMAWGLDVGDAALKAIKLTRDPKTGVVQVAACEYLLHEREVAGPDADLTRGEILEKTLREFASRVDLKGCQVIASLPAQRVLGRFCELPPLPAKKVQQAVQFEARHQFPIPLDELNWAYYLLNEAAGKSADDAPRRVMIVAARTSHVAERVQLLQRAGIAVNALQSESVALHNAVRYEFGEAEDESMVALIDVGVSSTSVVLSGPHSLWFRTFGPAGCNFTTQLTKQFQLTYEQAEQLKRAPAKARRYHLYRAATVPLLEQLSGEIERSLQNFHKQNPGRTISRVYGLGGGFRQHGLLHQLRFGK